MVVGLKERAGARGVSSKTNQILSKFKSAVCLGMYCTNKRYFIIEQQIAWYFVQNSECLQTPFPSMQLK